MKHDAGWRSSRYHAARLRRRGPDRKARGGTPASGRGRLNRRPDVGMIHGPRDSRARRASATSA